MELVNPEIEAYAESKTSEQSQTIKELVRQSDRKLEHVDMLSGKVVGRLLAMLVRISGAKKVLEIGTFTGYSALSMAEALPEDATLITCEYNKRYEDITRTAFLESRHGHKITLKMGPALETIKTLSETFDFVYLDADKINYPKYYKMVIPLLKEEGLMVIDNVLWGGSVLAPDNEKAEAIDQLNGIIKDDERVEQVMLTVRDGVTIVRKI